MSANKRKSNRPWWAVVLCSILFCISFWSKYGDDITGFFKNNEPAIETETATQTRTDAVTNKPQEETKKETDSLKNAVDEEGEYTSKEEVALYIHLYGKLPKNFITKKEATELGWDSQNGNLWDVCHGKSIGGDSFKNYEGKLPKKKNRKYYECDIDYAGGYRQEKRIVYSNDGLVYYTEDHYETFTLLYGQE